MKKSQKFEKIDLSLFAKNELTKNEIHKIVGGFRDRSICYCGVHDSGGGKTDADDVTYD
jgi:natural product precursor